MFAKGLLYEGRNLIEALISGSANNPAVSIIIVNYNGGEWLKRSVQSVADQTLENFECFIVDNGSNDASINSLPELDERFEIILAGENLGFAAGNNLAAQKARAPWIALLNPDAFARPEWLSYLLEASQLAPNVTMVGSTQYMALEPGIIDGLGDFYHVSGIAWRGGFGHKEINPPDTNEVFGPCAAAALYHRESFLKLGGFDERFFCYHEDVDLAFRMRLDGGICIQSGQAVVDHVSSGISGRASEFAVYHGTRNRIWTFVKNMPLLGLFIFGPLHLGLNLAFLFWSLFRKGRFSPTWRGIKDGIKGLSVIWKSRSDIHKSRKVGLRGLLRPMTLSPLKFLKRKPAALKIRRNSS